jgi:hypothetical protein
LHSVFAAKYIPLLLFLISSLSLQETVFPQHISIKISDFFQITVPKHSFDAIMFGNNKTSSLNMGGRNLTRPNTMAFRGKRENQSKAS